MVPAKVAHQLDHGGEDHMGPVIHSKSTSASIHIKALHRYHSGCSEPRFIDLLDEQSKRECFFSIHVLSTSIIR